MWCWLTTSCPKSTVWCESASEASFWRRRRRANSCGRWRGRGITLTLMVAFHAALALRRGLALLTDNTRHFPMKGLIVWTPRDVLAQ